jgi:hypothetical protein
VKLATIQQSETKAGIIAAMPEHQQDAMARTLIGCIRRLYEDPAIKGDYERWKNERYKGA